MSNSLYDRHRCELLTYEVNSFFYFQLIMPNEAMDPSDPISRLQNFLALPLAGLVVAAVLFMLMFILRLMAVLIDTMPLWIRRFAATCRLAHQVANTFQATRDARVQPSCTADGRFIPFDSTPVKRPVSGTLPKPADGPSLSADRATNKTVQPTTPRNDGKTSTFGFQPRKAGETEPIMQAPIAVQWPTAPKSNRSRVVSAPADAKPVPAPAAPIPTDISATVTLKTWESVRTCRTCGQTKPLDYRHYNQMRTGGFRWSCKNCLAAKTREYHQLNPKKAQERAKRYKERKAAAGGSYTDADIKAIRTRLGDRCGYCGDPLHGGGEVEHMLPVLRGGTSNPDNLTLACRTCNGDKGTKTVENFIAYLRKHGRPVRSDIWSGVGKP
jgi:5-methylcytosine-specific restriction endonuclease McrA